MFKFRSLNEIKELLINKGEKVSDSEDEDQVEEGDQALHEVDQGLHEVDQGLHEVDLSLVRVEEDEPVKKKKKVYVQKDDSGDNLPVDVRHIRIKEKLVRPEFYQACAALTGLGLSINSFGSCGE